jgi:ketosteroid isomerase-like protein
MSDLEAHKAAVLRLTEFFNSRQFDRLEEVLHPDFRERGISSFPPVNPEPGPASQRKLYEMFLQALPDARAETIELIAEGDKVVMHDLFGGTHRGDFLGRPGTGKHVEWMVIHIYTMRDGKILEDAILTDALAIVQALGLGPSPTTMAA